MSEQERLEKERARQAAWRAKNPGKCAKRMAAWRAKHPDKVKQQLTKDVRYKLNPEAERVRRREYHDRTYQERKDAQNAKRRADRAANPQKFRYSDYWKNPEKRRAARRDYTRRKPEKVSQHNATRRANMAKVRKGDPDKILAWEATWRKKRRVTCYWCQSVTPGRECHLDHIVAIKHGGPHDLDNLCVSCARCNLSKGSRTVEKWNSELVQPVLL